MFRTFYNSIEHTGMNNQAPLLTIAQRITEYYRHRRIEVTQHQYEQWLDSLESKQERVIMQQLGYQKCKQLPDLKRFVSFPVDQLDRDAWMRNCCTQEEFELYQLIYR